VAFIGTWLGSHPLLVGEVAAPFWIAFGLTVALAGSVHLNRIAMAGRDSVSFRSGEQPPRGAEITGKNSLSGLAASVGSVSPVGSVGSVSSVVDLESTEDPMGSASTNPAPPRWRRPAGVALGIGVIVMAIVAAANPIGLPASEDVDGFYRWETTSGGEPFRWSRQYASVFVPADAKRVHIPVRVPVELRQVRPLEVDVMVGGVFQNRTTVHGSWAMIDVELPPAIPPTRFTRIDLRADRAWQPALYIPGDGDLRQVGVQVGKSQLIREP
jgi:hypothetical protein